MRAVASFFVQELIMHLVALFCHGHSDLNGGPPIIQSLTRNHSAVSAVLVVDLDWDCVLKILCREHRCESRLQQMEVQ